jgi:hypothetical protein
VIRDADQSPPVTLVEVAKRAIEISDPTDADSRSGDVVAQFGDADEPQPEHSVAHD